MAMVQVWNDNAHPYFEKFREQDLKIPAKKFIEMDEGDAHLFLGTYAPIKVDGDGNPIPEGYKMLRIEAISGEKKAEVKVNPLLCLACAYEATSEKDLTEHAGTHKANLVVDEEAEREIAKRKRAKAS